MYAVAVASGYLGAILGVAMVVPQIRRTFRDRALPGVSAMSWTLTALACTTWMLYGLRTGETPQVPGNILIVTGAVVIVLSVPSATTARARAGLLGVLALVLAGLAIALPPPAIGVLAFAIGLFSAVPQLFESLTRPRTETSAVSILAWVLRGASQVCWLVYAIGRGDVTVGVAATFVLVSTALLVVSELRPRPDRSTAPALLAGAVS